MHLVQLGPVPPPEGGVSRNMQAIAAEVAARGYKCSFVATSKGAGTSQGPNVHRPETAWQLARTVRRLAPDVLHLHVGGRVTPRVLGLCLAATALCRKTVLTIHSGEFPTSRLGRHASRYSLAGLIFRRFSRVISVSPDLDDVFRRFGVADDHRSVMSPFSPSFPDPAVALPLAIEGFLSRHEPCFASVGGLEPEYDPLLQIEAFEKVSQKLSQAGLIMIGDGAERRAVEAEIARRRLSDRIMLTGSLEHADTLHVIDRADAMLRVTRFDGDAISVREAMNLGTPVIATDTSFRPKGIRIIPIGDRKALVDAMLTLTPKAAIPPSSHCRSEIPDVVDLYERLVEPVGASVQVITN